MVATKYQTANGTRWRVRYRKPDGTQTDKRGFKTKAEATLWESENVINRATGNYIDPTRSNTRLEDIAPAWLATKQANLKPSAYQPLEAAWRNHVQPTYGHQRLKNLNAETIQAWVNTHAQNSAPSTVRRAHSVLAGILDNAVRDKRIPTNPARDVQLPKRRKAGKAYLTAKQVELLAGLSPYPELVLFLAYTGLRFGEAVALNVGDVNTERKRVSVNKNIVYIGSKPHPGSTKTDQVRSVPYPLFQHDYITDACKRTPSKPLFGDTRGNRHPRPHTSNGWFVRAVRAAQDTDPTFPRVTPHDLRHTAASFAVNAGANVKAVQRMLGHASAAMTLDVYADLFDEDMDDVAERMMRQRESLLK